MKWRFISFKKYNPYLKIALNEVVVDSVKNTGIPVVWLAGWKPSCVNIGYGQHVRDVVNMDEALRHKIPIVRRQGGGGAMFLSEKGEISWSVVAPELFFPKNPNKIYERVCARIVSALKDLGIPARHKPINDVVTDKGKISGATIKKEGSVVYVGGTLLYSVDSELVRKLLRPERDHLKRQKVPETFKQVVGISDLCNASFKRTVVALKENLLKGIEHVEDDWSKEEFLMARKLSTKYKSKEWLFQK
jgi:lipoate-protein ligase A